MSLDEAWEQSGLVGKTVAGRYLIVRELAGDQRRKLYEAQHVEQNVTVSLAVVAVDGAEKAKRLREAQKLQSLEHPGLGRVLDAGKLDSGELYIATERPAGTTLRALGPVDPRRALLVVRQVLDALAAAHAVGTVHGDIRPESIVILPGLGNDRIKVIELGVATLMGATRPGDPAYSAPEASRGPIDARADIYSAGAVLFELLTGHPPFVADDADALRRLHAYAPVQTLAQRTPGVSFPAPLEAVVVTALAKSRDDRFSSAKDMVAALDPVLQAIEQTAPPPKRTEPRDNLDESVMLIGNDLLRQARLREEASRPSAPVVPVNIGRQIPKLSWLTRAELLLRRTRRRTLGIVGGVVLLALVLAVFTCAGSHRHRPDLAERAKALVDQGRKGEALNLIEKEIAAHPDRAPSYLALGDTQLALHHEEQAFTAYGKAIALTPAVAADSALLANLSRIAGSDDTPSALAALELIASKGGANGAKVIASHASTDPHAEVRHRAVALAGRAGAASQIDRVASWSLDLDQAETCDERRLIIKNLAKTADRRALPALERAKANSCVTSDAASAIQRITGT